MDVAKNKSSRYLKINSKSILNAVQEASLLWNNKDAGICLFSFPCENLHVTPGSPHMGDWLTIQHEKKSCHEVCETSAFDIQMLGGPLKTPFQIIAGYWKLQNVNRQ